MGGDGGEGGDVPVIRATLPLTLKTLSRWKSALLCSWGLSEAPILIEEVLKGLDVLGLVRVEIEWDEDDCLPAIEQTLLIVVDTGTGTGLDSDVTLIAKV